MASRTLARPFPALAATLLALLAGGQPGVAQDAGGSIQNQAPEIASFTHALGATAPLNSADVFAGTAQDPNGEVRLAQISLEFTTAPVGVTTTRFDRVVVAADRTATTEPAAFDGSGWKVWNTGGGDGVLTFEFQHTWAVSGDYVVRGLVQDQVAIDRSGPAVDLTVQVSPSGGGGGGGGGGGPGPFASIVQLRIEPTEVFLPTLAGFDATAWGVDAAGKRISLADAVCRWDASASGGALRNPTSTSCAVPYVAAAAPGMDYHLEAVFLRPDGVTLAARVEITIAIAGHQQPIADPDGGIAVDCAALIPPTTVGTRVPVTLPAECVLDYAELEWADDEMVPRSFEMRVWRTTPPDASALAEGAEALFFFELLLTQGGVETHGPSYTFLRIRINETAVAALCRAPPCDLVILHETLDGWERLESVRTGGAGDFGVYEAIVTSFSYFAVASQPVNGPVPGERASGLSAAPASTVPDWLRLLIVLAVVLLLATGIVSVAGPQRVSRGAQQAASVLAGKARGLALVAARPWMRHRDLGRLRPLPEEELGPTMRIPEHGMHALEAAIAHIDKLHHHAHFIGAARLFARRLERRRNAPVGLRASALRAIVDEANVDVRPLLKVPPPTQQPGPFPPPSPFPPPPPDPQPAPPGPEPEPEPDDDEREERSVAWGDLNAEMNLRATWQPREEEEKKKAKGSEDPEKQA